MPQRTKGPPAAAADLGAAFEMLAIGLVTTFAEIEAFARRDLVGA